MSEPGFSHLSRSRDDRIWTYVLLGVGGAIVLLLAPLVAAWLADVPFIPFSEPLRWVGEFDEPWQWVVRGVVGLALGLVLAVMDIEDEYRLEVGADTVVVVHGKDRRELARDQIVGIHRDGRKITIDGTGGRTLFDKKLEAPKEQVRQAFVSRGYPWESN